MNNLANYEGNKPHNINEQSLEILRKTGVIKDYYYCNVDENGAEGKTSSFRNSEKLIILFNSGDKLEIAIACSGSAEDTSMYFYLNQ